MTPQSSDKSLEALLSEYKLAGPHSDRHNRLIKALRKAIDQRDKELTDGYRMADMEGEEIGEAIADKNRKLAAILQGRE